MIPGIEPPAYELLRPTLEREGEFIGLVHHGHLIVIVLDPPAFVDEHERQVASVLQAILGRGLLVVV